MMQEKETQQPSRTGAAFEGALIGLLTGLDNLLSAELLYNQAKTAHEQRIAKANLDSKKHTLDKRKIHYQELMAQTEADKLAFDKEQYTDKKAKEDAAAADDKTLKENYSKSFKRYDEAHKEYLRNPSKETEDTFSLASKDFQYHGTMLDVDISHVADTLKGLETDKKKRETEQLDKDIQSAKKDFSIAYIDFKKTDPDSEDYAYKKTLVLLETMALNKLLPEDPTIQAVLDNLFTEEEKAGMSKAISEESTLRQAYEKALREYNISVADGAEDLREKKIALQSAGIDFLNNQKTLGKNTSVVEDTLKGLGISKEPDASTKDPPMSEAQRIREKQDLDVLRKNGTISEDAYKDLSAIIETSSSTTLSDYETMLHRYVSQKLTGDLGGGSNYERRTALLNNFPADSTHRPMLSALLSETKTELTGQNVAALLHHKDFDELDDKTKQTVATQVMAKDEGARGGDEITNRLLKTPRLTIDSLSTLFQQYKGVREKLDLPTAIKEGGFKFVGLTSDAAVTSFVASLNEYIDTDVRLRSGAQINRSEFEKAKRRAPGAKNVAELNDALFQSIGETMRSRMAQDLSRRYGKDWGDVFADYIYNQSFDVAEETAGKPSRFDINQPNDKELASELRADYRASERAFIDHFRGIVRENSSKDEDVQEIRKKLDNILKNAGFEEEFGEGTVEEILKLVFEDA